MNATQGSRHLVDPALAPLLDEFPPRELNEETLPEIRAMEFPHPRDPEAESRVDSMEIGVPGPADSPDVPVIVYRPRNISGSLPCALQLHGGGYVAGSAKSNEPIWRPLAAELGCVIVSVDYRLAPETRFPGAVEDCYSALKWLQAHATDLAIDIDRIGVTGDSAGGGLAAALALLVRDRGELRLAFQHLIYPMLDDRTCSSGDPNRFAGEFLWTRQHNMFGWQALLGVPPGSPGISPYAAAARAEDLTRLPPTYIATAALDLFVDENLEYARRLLRAGVPVELQVFPGAFHAFDFFVQAPVALRARRSSREALRRALHPISEPSRA